MTRLRELLSIVIVATCLQACTVLGTLGLEEPKISPPSKAQAPSPTPPPVPAAAAVVAAAPLPATVEGGPGSEGAPGPSEPATESSVPAPVGSKEGPPAPLTGPQAGPGKGPAGPVIQPGKLQYVSLNFDNADLELVLRSIADITGINFIIGPGVKANVTMRTTTRVPATEVFSIMESVLEVNNLVAVKEGSFYKIVPIAVAQQEPQDVQVGKERGEERERYVTQIIHLEHLSAEEMAKILQSFLARGAKMVVHKETNSLILAGFSSTVKRLLDTVKALDIPSKRDNIQRIFVYFVENVRAADLANILNTLYGRRGLVGQATTLGTRPGQPPARPGQPAVPTPAPPIPVPGQPQPGVLLPPGAEQAAGEVVGDVTIVPDEATNALIIKTSPRNYEFIETTIKKLDIVPKQVLIELLIAEITLTDKFNLSLEELIRSGSFAVSGLFGGAGPAAINSFFNPSTVIPPTGFTLTFVQGDKFRVVLNNLAQLTKVNILASPHLLTANNKEAKIQIGREVPIVTNEQSSLTSVTSGQTGVFRTLQQKDIGILLGIKPHVNEKRLVTLDIETENTEIDSPSFGSTQSPSFLKRTTKTALVVQDGQSLMLGGIIQQTRSKSRSGVPFLSEIPILGYLFRNTSDETDRTELIILITPHVVASPEEGMALTEQFKGRVESLEPMLKNMPRLPTFKP